MIVKDAVRRTHYSFSVSFGIPGNANARLKVVLIGINSLLQPQLVISSFCKRIRLGQLRRELDVIPQSEIQSEVCAQPPGILDKNAERFVAEAVLGIADTLHQSAGNAEAKRLNRGKLRNAWGETEL